MVAFLQKHFSSSSKCIGQRGVPGLPDSVAKGQVRIWSATTAQPGPGPSPTPAAQGTVSLDLAGLGGAVGSGSPLWPSFGRALAHHVHPQAHLLVTSRGATAPLHHGALIKWPFKPKIRVSRCVPPPPFPCRPPPRLAGRSTHTHTHTHIHTRVDW